jgi:hypothetical protein
MEQSRGADALRLALEGGAVGELDVFQLLDAREMPIHQTAIGQRPEMLSGLEFGRVRRQKEQVDVVGHAQLDAGVPAGPIEHEDDLLARTSADLAGELRQLHLKHGDADGGGQMEERPARGGMDKADEVAPGEAVLDGSDGPLPNGRPDAAQERLQANAMLIGGPEFDRGAGKGGSDRS